MKVSCTQRELHKALSVTARFASKKSTIPLTQNVIIETEGGLLKTSATDLNQHVSMWTAAAIDEEGATSVPARLINEFVGILYPDARVDLEIGEGERQMNVMSRGSDANLITTDRKDFPERPEIEDPITLKLNPQPFRAALGRVISSAATEETRPVLTGVNIKVEENHMTLAAADGFRLTVDRCELEQNFEEAVEAIIPTACLKEIHWLLSGAGQETGLEMLLDREKRYARFCIQQNETSKIELTTTLLAGTFPNYAQLIPGEYSSRAVLDASEVRRGAKTAAIFAKEAGNVVRMNLDRNTPQESQESDETPQTQDQRMTISGQSEGLGNVSEEISILEMEGEDSKIAFNAKYLTDLLSEIAQGSGQIVVELNTPTNPGVFRIKDNEHFVSVIMPMFVQW